MPIRPLSPVGSTSEMTASGSGRSRPFSKTRTRPGLSVKSMRPSGVKTIDQGTSKLETRVSTRKEAAPSAVVATSPAPRPGGGWPHASRSDRARASAPISCGNIFFTPSPVSVRDVLVEQLQFRALLADLDAHDVAHREHADEAFAVNDGQVSAADHLHPFERVVRRVFAVNDCARLAHHVAYRHARRVELADDDAVEQVALREDAAELPLLVEDADRADVPARHVLRRVHRARRVAHEVRLTVTDHMPDGNHPSTPSRLFAAREAQTL